MMIFRHCLIAFLALVTLPAGAQTITVETATGPAELAPRPETVVALDVSVVDTLDALNVPVAGTMGFLYVDYLDHVSAKARDVGTLFEPDLETIHAINPDLIILGTRSADKLGKLTRIAPAIDMTTGVDAIPEALARLTAFGQIFDKQPQASALETALKTRMQQARDAVSGQGNALIVMTNGPKISAYGAGGRFGWLHTEIGMPQAAPDISTSAHGQAISFEFINSANPDWLIVVDRLAAIGQPGEGARATLDNVLVRDTTAWKQGNVIYLDAADIYVAGGGVQSILRTLDTIIAATKAS